MSISPKILVTKGLKNRSCVTVFGSCSATLTVGEPLGDVSGSANHDFRTSVPGISGEIDASNFKLDLIHLKLYRYLGKFALAIGGAKQLRWPSGMERLSLELWMRV